MKRFAKFRELLDANFSSWHQLAPYAQELGCTQKSLNRATRDAVGLSAKEYIVRRIVLEAKRLLAHTDRPIYLMLALGRRAWLFAGSDRGAERAAVMVTLIMTARLNDVDPQAWLADVFARIAGTSQSRLPALLPWNWTKRSTADAQAAA